MEQILLKKICTGEVSNAAEGFYLFKSKPVFDYATESMKKSWLHPHVIILWFSQLES